MLNKYNFEIAMSAILSEKVAMEILTKEIERSVGKKVNKIEAQYDDDNKFTGFQAFFDHNSDIKKKNVRSSNEFIKWDFDQER